jgi:hypothetical protein
MINVDSDQISGENDRKGYAHCQGEKQDFPFGTNPHRRFPSA